MKYIWEKEDIYTGRFFHRGEEKTYAKSCLHKIGRLHLGRHGFSLNNGDKTDSGDKLYVMVAMTDGLIFGPFTAEELADCLTDGEYRPTTSKELVEILDNRKLFGE